jgi:hypothetical protein
MRPCEEKEEIISSPNAYNVPQYTCINPGRRTYVFSSSVAGPGQQTYTDTEVGCFSKL